MSVPAEDFERNLRYFNPNKVKVVPKAWTFNEYSSIFVAHSSKSMDPLSDVFAAMHVKTSQFVRLEFNSPWAFRFDGYEHAHFGVITRGHCWLSLGEASKSAAVAEGDCWLLPRGDTHTLRDKPTRRARPYAEVSHTKVGGVFRSGGRGAGTTVLCGNFTFDGQSAKWLTDILPSLIIFRMDEGNSAAMRTILQLLASESHTEMMGSAIVLSRVADILFVQAVRAHAAVDETLTAGWLRAIGDAQMSVALKAMHEGIERRWSVASLASTVGMSRSGFAARFKQLLGEAPLEYLTRWRMYKAAQFLRESDWKVAKIASLVGYESDGAFNKAFRRVMGATPGAYGKAFETEE